MDPLFAGLQGGILSSLRVVQCVVSVVSVVHNNKPNVSFLLCSLLAADTNTAQHHNNITALIFISTHLSLQSVADIHPNFKWTHLRNKNPNFKWTHRV